MCNVCRRQLHSSSASKFAFSLEAALNIRGSPDQLRLLLQTPRCALGLHLRSVCKQAVAYGTAPSVCAAGDGCFPAERRGGALAASSGTHEFRFLFLAVHSFGDALHVFQLPARCVTLLCTLAFSVSVVFVANTVVSSGK